MKKLFILLVVGLMLGTCGAVMADTTVVGGGGNGVQTAADCDVALYYPLGTLCQSTVTAKLYKGTGAAVEEITAASAGAGDVTGPAASSAGEVVVFDGVTGKVIKRSNTLTGWPYVTSGVLSVDTASNTRTALGVEIGKDVQAYDADLAYLAGFTPSDNVKTILNAANNAAIKTALGYYTSGDAITGSLTGNASTATALAANGANCSAGNYPLGVDASGAAESCTAAPTASSLHVDDILTAIGIASEATSLGTFTGTTIDDNLTVKAAMQALETAFEGLPGGHTQNTDTGTSSTVFQVDAGNSGPKIKNSSGTLEVRNAADNAYAPIKGTIITGTEITATTRFYGALTGDVTGNVSGTAGGLSGTPALPNGTTATTQSAGDNSTKVATTAYANALVNDTAYAASWNGVTAISPSKNAVYDEIELRATKANAAFSGTFTIPTTITGVLRADSGVVSADTDVTDIVAAGSTSAAGKLQLATNAETTTGTDTAKVTTPDDIKYLFARPFALGTTTPAAATFTTLNGGGQTGTCDSTITQGFCFDADGDLFVKSVSAIRVAGQTSYSDFYEIPANGNNKVTVKAADSLAADYTVALPSETGTLCSTGSVCTGYVGGTGTNHYWPYWTGTGTIGSKSITASRPVCTDASGDPAVCTSTPIIAVFGSGTCSGYLKSDGTCDNPAGSGDVTGGSTSVVGELAAYTDTSGKAITRSYVKFSGPSTSIKTKTISNGDDVIAELGQTNAFTALQSLNAGLAVGNAATGPGFIRLKEDSDNGTDYSVITGASDAGTNPTFTFAGSAAGSEDFAVTATANLWTFSSSTSALFAFTPGVAFNGGATIPTGNSLAVAGTGYAAFGADPADSGAVRLSNNTAIGWEQSTPGTDIFIALDGSDVFHVGQNAASISIGTSGTGNTTVVGDLTVTGNDVIIGSATNGVRLTGGNGLITFKGEGDGTDEDLTINLNVTNTATVSSSTGVTDIGYSSINLGTKGFVTAGVKVLSLSSTCTIGSDCDGTSVKVAEGGFILATAAIDITLPEIVASGATATQVNVGASLCIMSRDNNEAVTVHPNAADSFTPKDHAKQTAGNHIIETVTASTGAGNMICFVAAEADNWMQAGTIGTWDHE